jgi:hypothetical protein
MGWFQVSNGRLEYRGRITREPFNRWTATTEGTAAVARVAAGIRFSLFGRSHAARTRMWRAIEAASRVEPLATAITAEAARYMEILAGLSYADALPRVHLTLHRLVLVPRTLSAGRARTALFGRLDASPALAGLDEATRAFFLDQLVVEMDAAIQKSSPSPKRPVQAHEGWVCVGISKGLVWGDPLWSGPDGTGHLFMYELPRTGLPRRERKALEAAIAEMAGSVSALSRQERIDLVRAASVR